MNIKPYIDLLKLQYQVQFLEVIAGVLIVAPVFTSSLLFSLVLLFIASHLLMYGGLYTINDIKDIEEDRKNEHKRHRPLPSGQISSKVAMIYAATLIGSGLLIGYLFFPQSIFWIMVLLVVFNQLYTFVLKHIPFVEFLGNIITHPPRLLMGIILAGGVVSPYFLIAYFWFLLGTTTVRRTLLKQSKGSQHRANMQYYTQKRLLAIEIGCFVLLLLTLMLDPNPFSFWNCVLFVLFLTFVFGVQISSPLRKVFLLVYLR